MNKIFVLSHSEENDHEIILVSLDKSKLETRMEELYKEDNEAYRYECEYYKKREEYVKEKTGMDKPWLKLNPSDFTWYPEWHKAGDEYLRLFKKEKQRRYWTLRIDEVDLV